LTGGDKLYNLKIEHYEDIGPDSGSQSTWAGLDSVLIDEEFLYLDEVEADKMYA
jgi:hypothetical protein